eukprot:PhF_6_TR12300/c0_g1_i1/m.19535
MSKRSSKLTPEEKDAAAKKVAFRENLAAQSHHEEGDVAAPQHNEEDVEIAEVTESAQTSNPPSRHKQPQPSVGPMCSDCNSPMSMFKFCPSTGKRHAEPFCPDCGLARTASRFCPETGKPHSNVATQPQPARNPPPPQEEFDDNEEEDYQQTQPTRPTLSGGTKGITRSGVGAPQQFPRKEALAPDPLLQLAQRRANARKVSPDFKMPDDGFGIFSHDNPAMKPDRPLGFNPTMLEEPMSAKFASFMKKYGVIVLLVLFLNFKKLLAIYDMASGQEGTTTQPTRPTLPKE